MHAVQTRAGWSTRLLQGASLDWAYVAASTWILIGLHLDGWAHSHRPGLESFFTLWHAILYSGYGALALLTATTWVAHGNRMPEGYASAGVGAIVFLVGGVGDMAWHTLFGIEVSIEALLSPTHIALALGMALMVSGPLRAAKRATVPAILSASLLLSVLTFFTQFLQPAGRPWPLTGNRPIEPVFPVQSVTPDLPAFPDGLPTTDLAIMSGIGGIIVATALFLGLTLYMLRRFELPFGSVTLLLTFSGSLLAFMRDTPWWIAVALMGGLMIDGLVFALRPRLGGWRLRAFATAAPAALWATYFIALALLGGIWWSVHAWSGAIALSALAGLALSYVHT